MTGMRSRRISSTSRKPVVVSSAQLEPFPSSTAFEATVVAWTTLVMRDGATPVSSSSSRTPSTTPRA
jgi:hypothetical protein